MLSSATSCHCSLPLPHRPTHSQPQYLLSWQSSKPSDREAPQQSTGPVHFQHVPDRHQEVLRFLQHPPLKTTPRHSTNSGSIRDRPEYEPPAGDYPGVHISSVLPTPYERSQESSEQQPNDQAPCPRRRTFHARSPKRQPITNEMLGQILSQLDRDHKPSHDRLMLKAAITLGFFGLLRVSEFTVPNQHGFNPDQHLTTKDITMRKNSMVRNRRQTRGGKVARSTLDGHTPSAAHTLHCRDT